MKINIEIDGTPQEIAELKMKIEQQIKKEFEKATFPNVGYHFPPVYVGDPISPYKMNQVTCDSTPKMWN